VIIACRRRAESATGCVTSIDMQLVGLREFELIVKHHAFIVESSELANHRLSPLQGIVYLKL